MQKAVFITTSKWTELANGVLALCGKLPQAGVLHFKII